MDTALIYMCKYMFKENGKIIFQDWNSLVLYTALYLKHTIILFYKADQYTHDYHFGGFARRTVSQCIIELIRISMIDNQAVHLLQLGCKAFAQYLSIVEGTINYSIQLHE